MFLLYVSCSVVVLSTGAGLYCLYQWALARLHSLFRTLSRLERMTLAMLFAVAIVATIGAQKTGGDRSGEEESPAESAEVGRDAPIAPPRSGVSEVTNLCFTGISVSHNDVALSLAWPTNLLFAGKVTLLGSAIDLDGGPMVVGGGAWEGGIPEPSGGMLVLLGAAMLGLRRK